MMFPIHIAGIALVGKMLLSKKNEKTLAVEPKSRFKNRARIKHAAKKPFTPINPIETLVKGLNARLSEIFKKHPQENYDDVVKRFVPDGAELLIPKFPAHSKKVSLADIDGDFSDELIATYKLDGEIKTIILKKHSNEWFKASEIVNPEYERLSYRGVSDITGEGKKQLLIGLSAQEKDPVLYGYSVDNDNISELFTLNYDRFQILNIPNKNRNIPSKAQMAIWKRKDNDLYDIELLEWDGLQLQQLNSTASYYYNSVVPYYLQKVKQVPNIPLNWYNLADTLVKAGSYRDALIASEVGMRQNLSPDLKEKFIALRNRINKE